MSFLDWIGKPFVYRSPGPMTGERLRRFTLFGYSNRILRKMIPTTSHYAKRHLVEKIMQAAEPDDLDPHVESRSESQEI